MTRFLLPAGIIMFVFGLITVADEPRRSANEEKELTKATFLVTGLHCPPCTRTVESSLQGVKGIRSIEVDWKTKNAKIVFDETVLPAQEVARLIVNTPHMMGGNMHYDGWLAIKVSEIKDDATAKPVKEVLSKVEGVKRIAVYPKQHAVGVQFASKGQVSDRQLIEALTKAGYHATNL